MLPNYSTVLQLEDAEDSYVSIEFFFHSRVQSEDDDEV